VKREITFVLNGFEVSAPVAGAERLIDVLRGPLGQTGTKEGCGRGECGACTVLVGGRTASACLLPAAEVEGRSVTTIEGLRGPGGELSAVQRAFVAHGGIQCGFCSPGMILSAQALLARNPAPTEADVRAALEGNLCRCTGYVQIVESVLGAAAELRAAAGGERVDE